MADLVTVIGRSSFVRGRISGNGSLEIAGRIEGEVSVSGDLVVEATGLVAANLVARRITIRGGAVKGDLTAEDGIFLEAGSRVVGDLHGSRVSIAEGALVRGHVQTGSAAASAASKRAVTQTAFTPAVRRDTSAAGPITAREPRAIAKAAPPPPPPAKKAAPATPAISTTGMPRGSVLAGTRPQAAPQKAPAPIVPVLKKGAKATQKKRA